MHADESSDLREIAKILREVFGVSLPHLVINRNRNLSPRNMFMRLKPTSLVGATISKMC